MYNKEFWERTNICIILEFIRTGVEAVNEDAKKYTAEERHKYYTTKLYYNISLTRDKIIAFDWGSLGNDGVLKADKTDEMFDEIVQASCSLSDLAFEVGFVSGMKFFYEANERIHSKNSE